jgi:hypothetical protein
LVEDAIHVNMQRPETSMRQGISPDDALKPYDHVANRRTARLSTTLSFDSRAKAVQYVKLESFTKYPPIQLEYSSGSSGLRKHQSWIHTFARSCSSESSTIDSICEGASIYEGKKLHCSDSKRGCEPPCLPEHQFGSAVSLTLVIHVLTHPIDLNTSSHTGHICLSPLPTCHG